MLAKAFTTPIRDLMTKCNLVVSGRSIPVDFKYKNRIFLKKGRFTLKSVETHAELTEVLRLRYDIFHREFKNKKNPFGFDVDIYDSISDHLLIRDDEYGIVVGTYRLISSEYSRSFYSQNEFHLENFLSQPGGKLELGRACIHAKYRNGMIINLLWRGIAQYMEAVGARYLFGCASIKTMDPVAVRAIMQNLHSMGAVGSEFAIEPTPQYKMPNLNTNAEPIVTDQNDQSTSLLIPPLVKSYLKAGAKLYGEPALDTDFRCVDFLAILRIEDLTNRFEKKYRTC